MIVSAARFLAMPCLVASLYAQADRSDRMVVRVDETSSGPFGGQKSRSCLRIYSDSKVIYAEWSNSGATTVNAAGVVSRSERTSAFTYKLDDGDLQELSSFLESKAVARLPENFGPPHKPVDYFESVSVEIPRSRKDSKKISTREYYVADLTEKTQYPSALVLLMDRIDQIEKTAASTGKPTEVPTDCSLKPSGQAAP